VERAGAFAFAPEEIERRLEPLVADGLLVRDGARYLALAVPLGEYRPPPEVLDRFVEMTKTLGQRTTAGVVIRLEDGAAPIAGPRRGRMRPVYPRRARARSPRTLAVPSFSLTEKGELLIRGLPRP
jgi:hypothetical protein